MFPSTASAQVLGIHHYLREDGISEDDLWIKTAEFFSSEALEQGRTCGSPACCSPQSPARVRPACSGALPTAGH
jgi:hypothetical protein